MYTCYSLILLIVEYIKTYDMILGQSMSKKKAWVTGQIITTKIFASKIWQLKNEKDIKIS